jgi:hypothetical protein
VSTSDIERVLVRTGLPGFMRDDLVGRREGVPIDVYHALPGISHHNLMAARRSPAHFIDALRGGSCEPTAAMVFGRLVHTMLLEPGLVASQYQIARGDLRGKRNTRTKAYDEWVSAQPQEVEIIDSDDYRKARAMVEAARSNRLVDNMLSGGSYEVSFWGVHPETDLLVKARPDYVVSRSDGRVVLVDYKTTIDAGYDEFARAVARYGYHYQAGHHVLATQLATGKTVAHYVWVAQEKSAPYHVAAYSIDPEDLKTAMADVTLYLREIGRCASEWRYPSYPERVQPLWLPRWAFPHSID